MIVSTTKNGILGDFNYYDSINKLAKFVIDETDSDILIKSLSLEELTEIL